MSIPEVYDQCVSEIVKLHCTHMSFLEIHWKCWTSYFSILYTQNNLKIHTSSRQELKLIKLAKLVKVLKNSRDL